MTIDVSNIYDEAVAQGIETDNHESDLYLKDSPITRTLLRTAAVDCKLFISEVDRHAWWEIPFAYAPWWRKRQENVAVRLGLCDYERRVVDSVKCKLCGAQTGTCCRADRGELIAPHAARLDAYEREQERKKEGGQS